MPEQKLILAIHLVRHGETVANREGIIQGQQNSELTSIGIDQAVATAVRLRGNKYWRAYSSDLLRASRTAEIILEEHEGPELVKSALLREFSLGVQEGLPRGTRRADARRAKAKEAGVPLEEYVESRRESALDVQKRARHFLDALTSDAYEPTPEGSVAAEKKVLVVCHGGVLNVMMSTVMGLGEDVGFMSNCSVTIIEAVFDKERGRTAGRASYVARAINDEKHLVEAGLAAGAQVEDFVKQRTPVKPSKRPSVGDS